MTNILFTHSGFMESLPGKIVDKSDGMVKECTIETLSSSNQVIFHGEDEDHAIYNVMDNLLLAVFKAASSVVDMIGTAD